MNICPARTYHCRRRVAPHSFESALTLYRTRPILNVHKRTLNFFTGPWPHYFEIECVGRRRLAPIDVTSALKDALLAQESTCASAQSRNACENSAANVRCVWLDDDDNNDGGGNTTKCWSNFSGVVALTITLENVDEGSNGMTTENVSVSSETFESVRLQSLTSSDAALQVQCDRVMISNDATACSRVVECSRLANTSAPCVTMSFDGMNVQRVDAGAFLDFASTLVVISFRDNRALREVPTWMNVGLGSSLREMYLDEVGFETLSTGRFDGLAGLEMLSMSSIPTLVSIESGAFDGLVALRTLDLSHSGLSSFSQGMFGASLQNLRVLYLGHTPTTSISDGTFDGLDHLEELYLEHCNLEGEIGGDQLRGLSRRLRRLVLSNNGGIRGVSPDAFDSMRQEPPGSRRRRLASDDGVNSSGLESLWLNGGSIENLAPGTFSNMPNLTELMLFSNRLSVLRREIFADLVSLDTLHIQDNCIGTIEARAFANDRAIRRLDLSDQCLTRIEDDAFADTAFDEIDLSGNNVRYLSPDAFRNWTMELTNVSANVSQFSCEDRSEWSISENLTSLGRDVDSCSDFVALPDDVRGRLLAFRGSGDLTASQACWYVVRCPPPPSLSLSHLRHPHSPILAHTHTQSLGRRIRVRKGASNGHRVRRNVSTRKRELVSTLRLRSRGNDEQQIRRRRSDLHRELPRRPLFRNKHECVSGRRREELDSATHGRRELFRHLRNLLGVRSGFLQRGLRRLRYSMRGLRTRS